MIETIGNHILSLLIVLPVVGALAALFLPGEDDRPCWQLAIVFTSAEFILSLHLPIHYGMASRSLQFTASHSRGVVENILEFGSPTLL